jgi:carbon storage regulator CsrA
VIVNAQTIKVTVLEITRDKVRLGFEASGDVPVNRSEVWRRIHSNMRRQRNSTSSAVQ